MIVASGPAEAYTARATRWARAPVARAYPMVCVVSSVFLGQDSLV